MYAVIQTGGKQLRVKVGDVVAVEKVAGDEGDAVVFDRVLLVDPGEGKGETSVGAPLVDGAQVKGTVVAQERARKVRAYLYKPRQNSNRKQFSHRQYHTRVKIDSIEA